MRIENDIIYADESKIIRIIGTKTVGHAIRINEGMKAEDFEEILESELPVENTSSIEYEQEVISRIRSRYSVDQELAILRQRDSKPEEFAEYNAYAEQCKANVKLMIANEKG